MCAARPSLSLRWLSVRLERLCALLCSLLEEQSLGGRRLGALGSVSGEVLVLSGVNVLEVWTDGRGRTRRPCSGRSSHAGFLPCCFQRSRLLLPLRLLIFQSVSAVMFFFLLITLCSSPPRLYSSPFPHYSHTLSSVCVGLHRWAGPPAPAP